MQLLHVIMSDDLYLLFIHKDFRLDKNQLNSKCTDNQEFWELVEKHFADPAFVPDKAMYADNKHLDQEWVTQEKLPDKTFSAALLNLKKHFSAIRGLFKRLMMVWKTSGRGDTPDLVG